MRVDFIVVVSNKSILFTFYRKIITKSLIRAPKVIIITTTILIIIIIMEPGKPEEEKLERKSQQLKRVIK